MSSHAQSPWRSPGARDLAADPELGPLTLLDAALLASIEALLAFVPELDPRAATWAQAPPDVLAARQLVVHAKHLRLLIDDYRRELKRRSLPYDDIPF
jgi:hypothetical protein